MALRSISRRILAADGALSNVLLVDGQAGSRIVVRRVNAVADGDNSVRSNLLIGFALSNGALSTGGVSFGPAGVIADIMGMAAGAIYNDVGTPENPVAIGGIGERILFSNEVFTGGGLTLVLEVEDLAR